MKSLYFFQKTYRCSWSWLHFDYIVFFIHMVFVVHMIWTKTFNTKWVFFIVTMGFVTDILAYWLSNTKDYCFAKFWHLIIFAFVVWLTAYGTPDPMTAWDWIIVGAFIGAVIVGVVAKFIRAYRRMETVH